MPVTSSSKRPPTSSQRRWSSSWQLTVRRPERAAGLLALVLVLLLQLLFPTSGTDLSAQLARASFAELGPLTPVDFGWYAGFHPYGYSLLAPILMSAIGMETTSLVCAVASSVLFARLMRDFDRPWLTALSGAFFMAANVASGRLTFAFGATAALAALVLLPRLRWAVPFAALTGLFSPVAAAFLGFAAAIMVLRRLRGGWVIGVATSLPVIVVAVLFPGGGIQPMSPGAAVPGVLVGLAVAWVSTDSVVRTGSLLYAFAVVFFQIHDDPFGSNVLRLGLLLAVPLLLATTARRPTWAVAVVACGSLIWQLDPLVGDLRSTTSAPFGALNQHLERVGSQRVEVLAERDHREASEVIDTVPLARGWARQVDVRDNRLFYRPEPLQPAEYTDWLRLNAIDRVALPRRGPYDYGSVLAAALLREPVPGLTVEWSDRHWIVYRVENPRPIVSLPAELLRYDRTDVVIRSAEPAQVTVDIRWSRWLSLTGPGCIERDGGRVLLRFTRPGTVALTSSLQPTGRC